MTQPPSTLESLTTENAELQARVKVLEEAVEPIGTDYMTSEQHHPGYVLIPKEQFDRLRSAFNPSPTETGQ